MKQLKTPTYIVGVFSFLSFDYLVLKSSIDYAFAMHNGNVIDILPNMAVLILMSIIFFTIGVNRVKV